MKIVIAAAIYPPEVGGPSYYAANLEDALKRQRHEVSVVLYGNLKHWPSGVRHLLYAIKIARSSRGKDAIIAFDTLSGGLPAALAHMFTRTSLVIRIGGDFVWEHYLERTRDLVPLPYFYHRHAAWNAKEGFAFTLSRFVLRRARVVFSSRWQMNIWRDPYMLDEKKVHVVENAIEAKLAPIAPARKNFLFYTRQIALKNAPAFRRAFAKAQQNNTDILLEEGALSHAALLKRMRECYAVVLPSVSDITPNYIIDAMRCGKPFLLTKYSGYAEAFGHFGVLVDPFDESDMTRGIEKLCDPATYENLCAKLATFNEIHTYDDIAREFVALIEKKI